VQLAQGALATLAQARESDRQRPVADRANVELRGDKLSTADESTLYHHDQLNYIPPDSERGRRLARR
jgi:hypothetical protein